MRGPQPAITPARCILSNRACTVARATFSTREASSTDIRGSSANSVTICESSVSICTTPSPACIHRPSCHLLPGKHMHFVQSAGTPEGAARPSADNGGCPYWRGRPMPQPGGGPRPHDGPGSCRREHPGSLPARARPEAARRAYGGCPMSEEAVLDQQIIAGLRDIVAGTVLLPDDDGYDEARRVW